MAIITEDEARIAQHCEARIAQLSADSTTPNLDRLLCILLDYRLELSFNIKANRSIYPEIVNDEVAAGLILMNTRFARNSLEASWAWAKKDDSKETTIISVAWPRWMTRASYQVALSTLDMTRALDSLSILIGKVNLYLRMIEQLGNHETC